MDILPVYIVLMIGFPPLLWLLLRAPTAALLGSAALYALSHKFGWNLPTYPSGYWIINPLCWQLLFVFGAWCALHGAKRLVRVVHSPIVLTIAPAYLAFAFVVVMTWYLPLGVEVPRWLEDFMYPIDKSSLDVLRFAHFIALAALAMRFVPRDLKTLKSPLLRPVILCGENSLKIFCLGIFLSFAGQFILVEISSRMEMQLLISVVGIAVMAATAALITWYKVRERSGPGSRQRPLDGDIAVREAVFDQKPTLRA
jgi:hypothetical protein